MKKNIFFAILLAISLVACSKTNTDSGSSSGLVYPYNDLEFLQNRFVHIDSLGNFVSRANGATLDKSDTTVLFIGVDSLEEAKTLFKTYVSDPTKVRDSGNSMTYALTDEQGNSQGTAVFKKASGTYPGSEMQLVAEVTFENVALKYVKKLYFVTNASWPENYYSAWAVGEVCSSTLLDPYNNNPYKRTLDIKFVCIKRATNGQNGYLFAVYNDKSSVVDFYMYKNARVTTGRGRTYEWPVYSDDRYFAKTVGDIFAKDLDTYKTFVRQTGSELIDDWYWTSTELGGYYGREVYRYNFCQNQENKFEWVPANGYANNKTGYYYYVVPFKTIQ